VTVERQVSGDGMVRKAMRVNQGDLLVEETEFMDGSPEEPSEQESERS
jgi:hypothetical protein